jgi:enamine deaminase RidA (YjgF/YER057c/UK114 family)
MNVLTHPSPIFLNSKGLQHLSGNAYSQFAIAAANGHLVFIAGQVGNFPKGDFSTQVRQAPVNVSTAIEAAGGPLFDIAKPTVPDADHDREEGRTLAAEVQEVFNPGVKPTGAVIPVTSVCCAGQLVEIETVGVLPAWHALS